MTAWGPAPVRAPRMWGLGDVWAGLGVGIGLNVLVVLVFAVPILAQLDPTTSPGELTESLAGLATSGPFLIASVLTLWVGLLGAPIWATWRKGQRSLAKDFKFTWRPMVDIPLGIAFAFAFRLMEFGLTAAATGIGLDLSDANNASFLVSDDRAVVWTVALLASAAIGAPIVEELFFRGLTLQSLLKTKWASTWALGRLRLGTIAAVVISGVMFGVLHTTAFSGGGLYLIAVTSALGMAFATMVILTRRQGMNLVAHGVFNGIAVVALVVG